MIRRPADRKAALGTRMGKAIDKMETRPHDIRQMHRARRFPSQVGTTHTARTDGQPDLIDDRQYRHQFTCCKPGPHQGQGQRATDKYGGSAAALASHDTGAAAR